MRKNQSAISRLGQTLVVAPESAELGGWFPRQSRSTSASIRKKKSMSSGQDKRVTFNQEENQKTRPAKSSYQLHRSTENRSTLSSPNHNSQKSARKLTQNDQRMSPSRREAGTEKKRASKSAQKHPVRQRAFTTHIKKVKSKSPMFKQRPDDNFATFQPEESFHLFPQSYISSPPGRPSLSTTGKLSFSHQARKKKMTEKTKHELTSDGSRGGVAGPAAVAKKLSSSGIEQQIQDFKRENDACKMKIEKLGQRGVSGASSPHREKLPHQTYANALKQPASPEQHDAVAKSLQLTGKDGLDIFSKEPSLSDRAPLEQAADASRSASKKHSVKRNNYMATK